MYKYYLEAKFENHDDINMHGIINEFEACFDQMIPPGDAPDEPPIFFKIEILKAE